jgi:hypothetical protein
MLQEGRVGNGVTAGVVLLTTVAKLFILHFAVLCVNWLSIFVTALARLSLGPFLAAFLWENRNMTKPNLPPPHEQRKIEELLLKLAKMKPKHGTPAPIASGISTLKTA